MSTTVRFPLPASIFPPMKIPSDQAEQFAATSDRIVDATLVARHEYIHRYKRQLKPETWELVKRRTNHKTDLAVYKPRRSARTAAPAVSATSSPILIGAGSVEGTLDEVMLGLTATNTSAMRFVASTMYKNVADARVLSRMDAPSDADPHAFLGFKWVVKAPSLKLTPLARARDFIYLESTGVRDLGDGSGTRVGFQLMHSVDLSCCPSLPLEFGVVRGYISFCLLFVECGDNRVDVFCKGFVDPRGGLSRRVSISAAADVIMDCEHAVKCAQRKKIEWSLKEVAETGRHSSDRGSDLAADCEAMLSASYSRCSSRETFATAQEPILAAEPCVHCHTGQRRRSTITVLGHSVVCGICSVRVCHHCSRKVRLPGSADTATCCMACIDRAENIDAASFARELAQRAMSFQPQQHHHFSGTGLRSPNGDKLQLAPLQKKLARRH